MLQIVRVANLEISLPFVVKLSDSCAGSIEDWFVSKPIAFLRTYAPMPDRAIDRREWQLRVNYGPSAAPLERLLLE
jgi:hypothetical protein